jgi:hypothetical protein
VPTVPAVATPDGSGAVGDPAGATTTDAPGTVPPTVAPKKKP